MSDTADREVDTIVHALVASGLRKCSHVRAVPALSDDEQSNIQAKERFEAALDATGLGGDSVRELARFFGVRRSHLYERMCRRRTELAPLPEWFKKLEDYAEFQRLLAEFARTA